MKLTWHRVQKLDNFWTKKCCDHQQKWISRVWTMSERQKQVCCKQRHVLKNDFDFHRCRVLDLGIIFFGFLRKSKMFLRHSFGSHTKLYVMSQKNSKRRDFMKWKVEVSHSSTQSACYQSCKALRWAEGQNRAISEESIRLAVFLSNGEELEFQVSAMPFYQE